MATIRDVALRAGVGVGTASRVFSGRGPVAKETAARVRAAAAELDFRPSEIARALSLMTAGLVGVFVQDFCGAFFGPFLQAIGDELRTCQRRMVVSNGFGEGDARDRALSGIDYLVERECDGLLVFSNHLLDEDFRSLHARQPHLAVINRLVDGLETHCFFVDHRRGGALAAEALLAQGHTQIAVIAGPMSATDNVRRLDGFFSVLERQGIARAATPVLDGEFSFAGGWLAASRLLAASAGMTALFCANDEMAMGAMAYLQENGRRIPDDISVIGYDDTVMSGFTSPRLTTVSNPICEIGVNACRWVTNQCAASDMPVRREFVQEVVWRASLGVCQRAISRS